MPAGVSIGPTIWNMVIFRQLLDDVRRVYQQINAVVCGWN